jgi:acetyl esterase/lipase
MDVYTPTGDTVTARPVVILIHTGTYFDPVLNGSPSGRRTDSVIVELANRFAKRGYVVASIDHRRGWNPTGDAETKRKTILEATYRAIQDSRTAVRYFRKSHAEDSNPYGIDPDNIIMGGDGTGGYITYASAFLTRIQQVLITKFYDFSASPPVPYVDTLQLGDPYGIVAGSLNTPNWPTYSSDFLMGFAIGGALGDSSWVEAGGPAFAALQATEDRLAPYFVDDVVEPVNFDVVIASASGAYSTLEKVNEKGLNDVWIAANFTDPFSVEAATKNDGLEGLFPFQMEFTSCMSQCVTSIPNFPMDTCAYNGAAWQRSLV